MSRESCFDCVRKHIGQAHALLDETVQGYPRHFWWAVGHLSEAESESIRENRAVAREIRRARMDLMNHSVQFLNGTYQGPSMDDLLGRVCELIGDTMYLTSDPSNSKRFTSEMVQEILEQVDLPEM